jgi:hypothetical protein
VHAAKGVCCKESFGLHVEVWEAHEKAVFSQEKLILDNLFLDVNINIRKLLEIMQVILYGFYISVHQLTGHIIHHLWWWIIT